MGTRVSPRVSEGSGLKLEGAQRAAEKERVSPRVSEGSGLKLLGGNWREVWAGVSPRVSEGSGLKLRPCATGRRAGARLPSRERGEWVETSATSRTIRPRLRVSPRVSEGSGLKLPARRHVMGHGAESPLA